MTLEHFLYTVLSFLTSPIYTKTFLYSSSSSASRVSPVHTEPAKPGSSPLQRFQHQHQALSGKGAPPASAVWIFSSCVAAEIEGWCPLSARGHTAVPTKGQEQRRAWGLAFFFHFIFHLIVYLKRDNAHWWTFLTINASKCKYASF